MARAAPQNDTLIVRQSAVITDTKFYFPSFFEENRQQRGRAEEEAFRRMPLIPAASGRRRGEIRFSAELREYRCRSRSFPAGAMSGRKVKGRPGKPVSYARASARYFTFQRRCVFFGGKNIRTTNIDTEFYLSFTCPGKQRRKHSRPLARDVSHENFQRRLDSGSRSCAESTTYEYTSCCGNQTFYFAQGH